jgi:putative phosphoribosyl transferase
MRVAVQALRRLRPARIVVAAPIASAAAGLDLKGLADEVAFVATRRAFYAVSQFYDEFRQITDEEVNELLANPAATR